MSLTFKKNKDEKKEAPAPEKKEDTTPTEEEKRLEVNRKSREAKAAKKAEEIFASSPDPETIEKVEKKITKKADSFLILFTDGNIRLEAGKPTEDHYQKGAKFFKQI